MENERKNKNEVQTHNSISVFNLLLCESMSNGYPYDCTKIKNVAPHGLKVNIKK